MNNSSTDSISDTSIGKINLNNLSYTSSDFLNSKNKSESCDSFASFQSNQTHTTEAMTNDTTIDYSKWNKIADDYADLD